MPDYKVHEETEKILVGRSSFHCQTCLGVIPDSYPPTAARTGPSSCERVEPHPRSAPGFPSLSVGLEPSARLSPDSSSD